MRLQYVKQEEQTIGDNGKEARAIRLITEYASRRIGKMAFQIAAARPKKVGVLVGSLILTFLDSN